MCHFLTSHSSATRHQWLNLFSTRHECFTSDVGLTRTRLVSCILLTYLLSVSKPLSFSLAFTLKTRESLKTSDYRSEHFTTVPFLSISIKQSCLPVCSQLIGRTRFLAPHSEIEGGLACGPQASLLRLTPAPWRVGAQQSVDAR